jgi:hypothetical protein
MIAMHISIESTIFSHVTPFGPIVEHRRFGGSNAAILKVEYSQVRNQQEAGGKLPDPEDGRSIFLRIVGELLPGYTALESRGWHSS